jgi:serine protease Do
VLFRSPFGLSHSVSVGIISAKERRDIAPSGRQGLYNFLQTDASINPGNSGGPLINTRGEVIGINSAINAQGQGIGFAIPINMVKRMLPSLEKGGKFVRSWIGIKIQGLTPELAQSYGLDDTQGVLVADVVKGGPGALAGLRDGDVILEFDGKKLHRSSDLPLYASMTGVGRTVPVVIWRDRGNKTLSVKLEAFPDEENVAAAGSGKSEDGSAVGLALVDLTPELASQLGVESRRGAVVESIEGGSAAEKAGLERGDLLLSIDGRDVESSRDAAQKIKAAKSGQVLRLRVERAQARIFVALRKP